MEWKPIATAPKDSKIKLWYFPKLTTDRDYVTHAEMITADIYKPICHRQPTLWMYAPMPNILDDAIKAIEKGGRDE